MKLLFKLSNTGGKPATVGNSNFKEHFAAINSNTAWSSIEPSIRRATEKYLIPHVSKELYEDLATVYADGDPLSTSQEEFLTACQDVVAYYTILDSFAELNISIGDMGIVEKGSNQQPVSPVAQWRYRESKYEICKKADELLDYVIRLLEGYIHENIAYFALWSESSAYGQTRTCFFSDAKDFSRYVNINASRRMLNELTVYIFKAEEQIDKVIGEDQFNALASDIMQGETLTAPFDSLVEKIKRFVASKAVTMGAPKLLLRIEGGGISLSSYTDGIDSTNHYSQATRGAEAVEGYIQGLKSEADTYFQDMMNFIYEKIDDMPLIKNSAGYGDYSTASSSTVYSNGPGGVFL